MSKGLRFLILASCGLTACAGGLSSSSGKLSSQSEAGAVLLSVASVAPWDDVRDSLKPNFKVSSADELLDKVAPSIASRSSATLDAASFDLGVQLDLGTTSRARSVVTNADGSTTDTSQVTRKRETPSSAPVPASGLPAGVDKLAAPAGTKDPYKDLDPMLQYGAANSLYQYIQLLNTSFDHVSTRKDRASSYVVHAKLSFMPYRRKVPYDLHAIISFFPSNWLDKAESTDNVSIIPILVTDDVERINSTRTAELSRRIGLALKAGGGSAAAGAEFARLLQDAYALSANEVNSKITVTRASPNTLYVRVGATVQGASPEGGKKAGLVPEYSLVGQTYDVFFLLQVPKAGGIEDVDFIMHKAFRHVLDGSVLEPTSIDERLRGLKKLEMKRETPSLPGGDSASDSITKLGWLSYCMASEGDVRDGYARTFLSLGTVGGDLPSCPSAEGKTETGRDKWKRTAFSWPVVARAAMDGEYQQGRFHLPGREEIGISSQGAAAPIPTTVPTASVREGENGTTVTLYNVRGDSVEQCLVAQLVRDEAGCRESPRADSSCEAYAVSTSVSFDRRWGVLSFAFPRLADQGISDVSRFLLRLSSTGAVGCPGFSRTLGLKVLPKVAAKKPESPLPVVYGPSSVVTRSKDGTGKISMDVDPDKALGVRLSLAGAELQGAQLEGKLLPFGPGNRIDVTAKGRVQLSLGNMPRSVIELEAAALSRGSKGTLEPAEKVGRWVVRVEQE